MKPFALETASKKNIVTTEQNQGKVIVPLTIRYWLAFLLLSFICIEAHETFHHVSGAALCGGFGTMTLSVYEPKPNCLLDPLVTLSGPFLTFAIAWFGAYLISKNRHMLFACTLIFASFAHLRFPLPLNHSGDEWYVVRTNFEHLNGSLPARLSLAILLFLLALPPLIKAFRSMAAINRLPVFVAAWLLPLFPLIALPVVDEWLFGPELNQVGAALMGIPVIVLVLDAVAILLIWMAGSSLFHRPYQTN